MFRIVSSLYDVVGIYALIEMWFIFGAIVTGIWMLIEFFEDDIKKRWKIISTAATVCLVIIIILG